MASPQNLSINEILPGNEEELYRLLLDALATDIRVAMPGIIQSFDPDSQTAVVQPAIREQVLNPNKTLTWVTLPLIPDVPVQFPRAGGFSITFPITKGDECLLVFGDMCMDSWWQNGGVQNQAELRRHDLSDAYAIIGITSQARKLSNYSMSSLQIRSDDGETYISMQNGEIDLVATTIKANGTVIG